MKSYYTHIAFQPIKCTFVKHSSSTSTSILHPTSTEVSNIIQTMYISFDIILDFQTPNDILNVTGYCVQCVLMLKLGPQNIKRKTKMILHCHNYVNRIDDLVAKLLLLQLRILCGLCIQFVCSGIKLNHNPYSTFNIQHLTKDHSSKPKAFGSLIRFWI